MPPHSTDCHKLSQSLICSCSSIRRAGAVATAKGSIRIPPRNLICAVTKIMDFADSTSLNGLVNEFSLKRRRIPVKRRTLPMGNPVRIRHCKCGICKSCRENRRWEQIFAEKFADPNYYGSQPVRQASSLGWLR